MNDIAQEYNDVQGGYKKLYESKVKKLLKVDPGAKIVVVSIIPPSASSGDSMWEQCLPIWNRDLSKYNRMLKTMCKENGWTFADCTYLGENGKADIYQDDGFHFVNSFYKKWASAIIESSESDDKD